MGKTSKKIEFVFIICVFAIINYFWIYSVIFKKPFPKNINHGIGVSQESCIMDTIHICVDSLFMDPYLHKVVPIPIILKNELSKPLHISEELNYYSMDFLRNPICLYKKNLDEKLKIRILETAFVILEKIDQFDIMPKLMKYNDHVVSSRLEVLIMLLPIVDDKQQINILNRHISYCIENLLTDKKFNWQTNHGLMQLRSMLFYISSFPNSEAFEKVKQTTEKRINILLDYHIAQDGSVYESASSYWFYIYNQWKIISDFKVLNDTIIEKIETRLLSTQKFLNNITTKDGFVQGIGDAYNEYVNILRSDTNSIVFNYQNKIAGFKYNGEGIPFNLLFVSADNPPNVHKHPEDLSLYVYNDQPLFINPGTYGYDNSPWRMEVGDQKSQNTVIIKNQGLPLESAITKVEIENNILCFEGVKKYKNMNVYRKVMFDCEAYTIHINDSSNTKTTIYSNFNIHPDLKPIQYGDNTAYLVSKQDTIAKLVSESSLKIDTITISSQLYNLSKINQIQFAGIINKISIYLYHNKNISCDNLIYTPSINENTKDRWDIYQEIQKNEKGVFGIPYQTSKRLFWSRLLFACLCITTIIILKRRNIVLYIIVLIYLLDIILTGGLLSLSLI